MIVPNVHIVISDVRRIQLLLCEASKDCSKSCDICLNSEHNTKEFNDSLLTGSATTLEVPAREDSNVYSQIQDVLCGSGECASISCVQCAYDEVNLKEFIQIIKGD